MTCRTEDGDLRVAALYLYFRSPFPLARIRFLVPESKEVWKHIETASVRSHHNPRKAFEDFLTMTICALSGGRMEEEYLKTVQPYAEGEKGRRAIDAFPEAFSALVEAMEKTRSDILGDIFEGAITFGENGQFFTPEHVCKLMAQVTADGDAKTVYDPCVGSGRNLLAYADINPHATFYGTDVDHRCVKMTAINLAFRNLYGWIVWGNSLTRETHLIYRTGFDGTGFISTPESVPEPVKEKIEEATQLTLF